mmetsp:Transcript_3519/g.6432  ORF Transcript_3519/g.6432 Transcript_3519/m.6432 type:complete len:108 (-) Transcript_3519:123-446(-)|eukprot:CAMPEP_0201882356 /NCGR_PEP_ID=MMETSP0902-20130614/13629_1 /ASSEMBLY_ACC=CAM_ASM_000551 /TAXON_ID=420261 /ORGANISM="Thalassiosira antarctica, Strain CCMP982" /LENGTH=107 /DNA_ID=CAMNT_0048410825 /DNA_START=356 /DNA_END=679 /DNA_ORIENTATION=-
MMGTAKIAELPSNPPKALERIVVGSIDDSDRRDDDDSVLMVNNSAGRGVAFNGAAVATVAILAGTTTTEEGTNANADEMRARQKRRVVEIWGIMAIKYGHEDVNGTM